MRAAVAGAAAAIAAAGPGMLALGCRPLGPEAGEVPREGEAAPAPERGEEGARAGERGPDGDPPEAGEVELLLGAFCPEAARGRPALAPALAHADGWYGDSEVLGEVVGAGEPEEIAVFGFDGRRAGVMAGVGAAREGGARLLVGSYAGTPPCAEEVPLGEEPEEEPDCLRALGGCGVALGRARGAVDSAGAAVGGAPEAPDRRAGGACVEGGALAVDVEGEGRVSRFPLIGFADGDAPVELVAAGGGASDCEPAFAFESMVGEERVDVLAVADFDGSGRVEVLFGRGEAGDRSWVLYSATSTPARLDRVAEVPAPGPTRAHRPARAERPAPPE